MFSFTLPKVTQILEIQSGAIGSKKSGRTFAPTRSSSCSISHSPGQYFQGLGSCKFMAQLIRLLSHPTFTTIELICQGLSSNDTSSFSRQKSNKCGPNTEHLYPDVEQRVRAGNVPHFSSQIRSSFLAFHLYLQGGRDLLLRWSTKSESLSSPFFRKPCSTFQKNLLPPRLAYAHFLDLFLARPVLIFQVEHVFSCS